MRQARATDDGAGRNARITDWLRDAVVELEVWRQNARSVDERHALHRITALLSQAVAELRHGDVVRDPFQEHLPLPAETAGPQRTPASDPTPLRVP